MLGPVTKCVFASGCSPTRVGLFQIVWMSDGQCEREKGEMRVALNGTYLAEDIDCLFSADTFSQL